MSEALLRDALRQIQDIVIETKGSPLDRAAVRRVEEILERVTAPHGLALPDSGYSQREVTILFADLRGFSVIAATYPAEVVLRVLSRCFGLMTEIAVRHYGTIDRFMGDAIMVVFHGENPSPRDHAQRALLCAVEMQLGMNDLKLEHREEGLPEMHIGIGVNSGQVMAGLIGSDAYRAYTVIGEDVNLAARIEAFSLRGQVLMSEATYEHCQGFVQTGEPMDVYVKGRSERMRIREALAIPELGKVVPRQDQRKSPRVELALRVDCRPVTSKFAGSEVLRGVMRDLSYYGARVELDHALPLYSEIKLAFDLSCIGYRADDIYARVVSVRGTGGRHCAGLEFTSLPPETSRNIHLYVQMRLQGECAEDAAQVTSVTR